MVARTTVQAAVLAPAEFVWYYLYFNKVWHIVDRVYDILRHLLDWLRQHISEHQERMTERKEKKRKEAYERKMAEGG